MSQQRSWSDAAFLLCLLTFPLLAVAAPSQDKVPITTNSEQARQLYLQGRDAAEKLRGADAYPLFQQAVAKDPGFALAYLAMANSAPTNQTFFTALRQAVALASKVSEGERWIIDGTNAGVTGDVEGQRRMFTELAKKYPSDERALTLLGIYYFGLQDYPNAIRYLTQATQIAPNFTTPYNQLGYAYRFEGNYGEAEKMFKKYIELLPGDPNPYDSYGEFLMKVGRFDESIVSYQKALEVDPHFTASMVGIANDQMFLGKGDEARKTLRNMANGARNDGERQAAFFWIAQSYVLEGKTDEAVRAVGEQRALCQKSNDLSMDAANANYIGNILLHAGQLDAAAASFAEGVALMQKASVPAEVKEAAKRNHLYDTSRVALKRGDVKSAQSQAASYQKQVEAKQIPFEVRQMHRLLAMVAIAQRDYDRALAELTKGGKQNPEVQYLTALALQGKGDAAGARTAAQAVVEFNDAIQQNMYIFIRPEAQKMLSRS